LSKNFLRLKYIMAVFNSKERHKKFAIMVHILQNTWDCYFTMLFFAEKGKEMYKDSKGAYRTMLI